MRTSIKPIVPSTFTSRVVRLTNGWLVTAYKRSNTSNLFDFIYSSNNGLTWNDLCYWIVNNADESYPVEINAIIADGNNVFAITVYQGMDMDDTGRMLARVYFNATTVTASTDLSYGESVLWPYGDQYALESVTLQFGRYHYLTRADFFFSWTKSHNSINNTSLPSNQYGAFDAFVNEADAKNNGSYVHALSNGQEWIFYGASNQLCLRRRLTPDGESQAIQLIQSFSTNTIINRIAVVFVNGVHHIFYAYYVANLTSRTMGYTSTTDGLNFTTPIILASTTGGKSSGNARLDFDVFVDKGDIWLLVAIDDQTIQRLLHISKFDGGPLLLVRLSNDFIRQTTGKVIRASNENNFTVDFATASSLVTVGFDVDGIKQLIDGAWTNIEQAYRHNVATWQEQNGKRMTSGAWNDIT